MSQSSQTPQDVFQHLWNQAVDEVSINPQFEIRELNEGDFCDETFDLEVNELELTFPNVMPNLPSLPSQPTEYMAQPQRYPSIDSGAPPSEHMSELTRSPGTNSVRSPVPGPQNGAASQTLPSNTVWPGEFNFQISLEHCGENAEKSISWTYSSSLKKLYVDREKVCPINMKTDATPPEGTRIRVMPIFQKVSFMQDIVKCCPHHVGKEDEPDANHVVVCKDPGTIYEADPNTGRYSLTIPLLAPQAGNNFIQYLFMFKCFTSCVGGLNRRPIQLIFTLENNGEILGRQVLDTRICACPGRDRKSDERNKEKPKKGSKRTKQITQTLEVTTLKKKPKLDKEVFTIRVEGREKYEILLKIKEALDLKDHVSEETKEAYFKREEQLTQLAMLQSQSSSGSSVGGSQSGSMAQTQPHPCLSQQPSLQQMQPMVQQQVLMAQQCPQSSQSVPMNHQPLSTVSSTSFSDLLSQPMFPTTSQPFDVEAPVSTQESDPGFTTLQSLPSLSRGDTLPVLTNVSPSLHHYLIADHPDGPTAMDQSQSDPSTVQGCQVTSSIQEKSIQGWLDGIGCGQYGRIFQEKGFNTIDSLEDIQYEFFNEFSISQQDRETIWKSIIEHRNSQQHLKSTPPMTRERSNASTISHHSPMTSSQGQVVRATRYTLRQTFSFKVKDEEDE
ncbi:Tumor protein 63 [Holothuria leucospilota]|uniref:Tumor protein 63 n=1 Tax=Holothuria leucospilota TaxID=206669 RepID=A0A9Q1BDQ1_HOLLE|nr:Tumor protein 63 [Holothuria leucospilota]